MNLAGSAENEHLSTCTNKIVFSVFADNEHKSFVGRVFCNMTKWLEPDSVSYYQQVELGQASNNAWWHRPSIFRRSRQFHNGLCGESSWLCLRENKKVHSRSTIFQICSQRLEILLFKRDVSGDTEVPVQSQHVQSKRYMSSQTVKCNCVLVYMLTIMPQLKILYAICLFKLLVLHTKSMQALPQSHLHMKFLKAFKHIVWIVSYHQV